VTNDDQEEFWTASAGPAWVALQTQMDALLQPVLDDLLSRAVLRPGDKVLDIGCGTGASVAEAAMRVGPQGHITGLDIAETMLALARRRLEAHPNTSLLKADAQTHAFPPGQFDAMISRFGVMFFDDTVAALRSLAAALAPGGAMTFAAWGPAPRNPWFMEPAAAAAEVLPPLPKVDRTQPGPFAFEDQDRVTGMMDAAGLVDVHAETVEMMLTPMGGLAEAADLCCHIGPADRALQYHEADDEARMAVAEAIAARFAPFVVKSDGLHIPAVINIFEARKPG